MLHPIAAAAAAIPHDPDLLPDLPPEERAVAHRRALLFRSSRRLAVGAASVCLLTLGIQDLPASAATVQQTTIEASLQSLRTAATLTPLAVRADYGVSSYQVVQWPLAPGTPMSSGFGFRSAPCVGCSSMHEGVDWNAQSGTPIEAIADGVVVGVDSIGWQLGSHVVIEHEIDGVTIRTVSGHMLVGSSDLAVGDSVIRGQVVGRVGNSGLSTGTHLHFGIERGAGGYVDPVAWLQQHVNVAWGQ